MAPSKAKVEPTFAVDKAGLAKQLARKGKAFAVVELIQNAWDENTTVVHVTLEPRPEAGLVKLTVEDDNPEGFADLTHAYTLFAESAKKDDPGKRGRFNLGEKLVIAICTSASIETTKGTILFTDKGRVHAPSKRKSGSVFTGILPMTDAEQAEVAQVIATLIPPPGIKTTFNLTTVPTRTPLLSFEAKLRTERSDEDGNLKATTRKTVVEVYDPLQGEVAMIYEMGIPVVETGDRFHVNVGQKIPLNMDRDNVPPAYLRDLRALLVNATYSLLSGEDMKAAWVMGALEDGKLNADAVGAVVKGRFGDKIVIADPTDPEANKLAASAGFTVIPGGALPKGAWKAVKDNAVALPAGKVTPSPKVESGTMPVMDPDHWPSDVARVADFAAALGERLLGVPVTVRIVKANDQSATWTQTDNGASGVLTFYLGSLGFKWFRPDNGMDQLDLILHEFGHHYCTDHLDRKYLYALTKLGAQTTMLALAEGEFFNPIKEPVVA